MRIIAGEWGGRRIRAPSGRGVRPTTDRVREAWMGALHLRLPGARVLDLFAGSGALGLEALSRGAREAVLVESHTATARLLARNVESLGAGDRARVVRSDVFRYLEGLREEGEGAGADEERAGEGDSSTPVSPGGAGRVRGHPFDLALADPPYGEGLAGHLAERFLAAPFARELWLEHRRTEPVPEAPGSRRRQYGDTMITTYPADTGDP